MNVEVLLFGIFAVVALAGALTMVTARNPVYSALGLLAAMFAVAVFYVMNDAHFVAAVQVLIYAGAVMTLFLFVIMLIGVDKSDDRTEQIPFQRPVGLVLGAGLLGLVLLAARAAWVTGFGVAPDGTDLVVPAGDLVVDPASGVVSQGAPDVGVGTIERVSAELFDAWLFPFEATVLLLTIAAVGTVALARFGPRARDGSGIQDPGSRTAAVPGSKIQDPGSHAEPGGSA
jgi:NADH-quinone oxidoreductase subunit J